VEEIGKQVLSRRITSKTYLKATLNLKAGLKRRAGTDNDLPNPVSPAFFSHKYVEENQKGRMPNASKGEKI